ncbi:MAG: hypothetical protein KatS3mg027_0276 [Bacteroidia bacterium]|nr:MAG: hypothetical protein KatS3mg027_0276 [Bacteroidia bacterium]
MFNFLNRNNLRLVWKVFSGIILSQLIPLVFIPIFSRLFSPDDYALLGITMVLSNILYEFYALKYDKVIVISSNHANAINAAYFVAMIGVLLMIVVYLFESCMIIGGIADDLKKIHSDMIFSLLILPLLTLFMSLTNVFNLWFQRLQLTNKIVNLKILQMIMITFITLLLGILKYPKGLIIGYFLGWMMTFLIGLFFLIRSDFKISLYSYEIIKYIAKRYIKFPIYTLFPSLLYVLALSLPYIVVNKQYGNINGGFFSMIKQITSVPLSYFSLAYTQIYLRHFSKQILYKKQVSPLLKEIVFPLLIISIIVISILWIGRNSLLRWLLGEKWNGIGELASLYVFAAIFQMIFTSVSIFFSASENVRIDGSLKFVYFIMILGVFLIEKKSFQEFIVLYTIVETVFYLFAILITFYLTVRYDKKNS